MNFKFSGAGNFSSHTVPIYHSKTSQEFLTAIFIIAFTEPRHIATRVYVIATRLVRPYQVTQGGDTPIYPVLRSSSSVKALTC